MKDTTKTDQTAIDRNLAVSSSFYSDGKDYSHLKANSDGFDEEAEDGEFNGTCVNCGSENITITGEADICHECGFVYT